MHDMHTDDLHDHLHDFQDGTDNQAQPDTTRHNQGERSTMSIMRKLAFAILMAFGLTLLAAAPAAASGADTNDKRGEIRVCKVLKDGKGEANFTFVIREKKGDSERDKYKFDLKVKGDEKKCSQKFEVDKGAYVVREKDVARGFKLHDIDVKGCYYKDRNDRDAKVVVDVDKHKCTVTFTNKKDDRK
jgi:hypothetical protein